MTVIQTHSAGAAAPVRSTNQGATVGADFNTFLTMLTVQMRNQDPLNPVDSTDYAVQLATFAGVEQQTRTNELLSNLLTAGQADLGGLAGLLGGQVRAAGPVRFDGSPREVHVAPVAGASAARLIVADSGGRVVGSQPVDPAQGRVAWHGLDDTGRALPAGSYDLRVEYLQGDSVLDSQPVTAFATVAEVRLSEDGGRLVLDSGAEIGAPDVLALRGR